MVQSHNLLSSSVLQTEVVKGYYRTLSGGTRRIKEEYNVFLSMFARVESKSCTLIKIFKKMRYTNIFKIKHYV